MDLAHLPTPWRLVASAASWPLTSQQQAQRNALAASCDLTARRQQLREVEDFVAELESRHRAPVRRALPSV